MSKFKVGDTIYINDNVRGYQSNIGRIGTIEEPTGNPAFDWYIRIDNEKSILPVKENEISIFPPAPVAHSYIVRGESEYGIWGEWKFDDLDDAKAVARQLSDGLHELFCVKLIDPEKEIPFL